MGKASDVLIAEVRTAFEEYAYRSPMKFGGRVVERAKILNVALRLTGRDGREAAGFGSMPMGNTWSFPSARLSFDQTLDAMLELVARIARSLPGAAGGEHLDPFQHGLLLERLALDEAVVLERELKLAEPIPKLCALVVASSFDAAVHDGFGKLLGASVWDCYGPEHLNRDLGEYLDAGFAGEFPEAHVSREPKPRMPLYHLVGALDALTGSDLAERAGDGLPETLGEWIARDGLTHLKIKLNGDDLEWDVGRVLAVDRAAEESAPGRDWRYSLDFNEKCENVDYLLAFLGRLEEGSSAALGRVQYIEQPTARDLAANPENVMHRAAEVKPVVIDESLTGYDSLILAGEMGYSGVALKACKGQTGSLLMAAAAARREMFLCVQDLTCPGASFLHSASLAAHVPGASGVEGNARQYCPAANDGWRERFPGVFDLGDGTVETGAIAGPGLGCVPPGDSLPGVEEE
jgi:L-alanine-DL-glutamate epimerase-like enolase superfamily enzyme